MRGRQLEPGHTRSPRPPRRGRSIAGKERLSDRCRRRIDRGLRLQNRGRPLCRTNQRLPRPHGLGDARHDAREPARERKGAHGVAARAPGQGSPSGARLRRGGHRSRRQAQGRRDRRLAGRQGGRHRATRLRFPGARDELRDHAQDQGRRGEGRAGDSSPGRGGSDASTPSRPADGRGDPVRA